MKEGIWNKKIPTIFGIFIIVIGVGITTFLVNQGTIFKSNASASDQPKNVRITNITDTSFTASYTTEGQVPGSLNYGTSKALGQSALDDRDQQAGNLSNYNIHNVTVQRLSKQTQYFFTITSGQNSYSNDGQPFTVTTGPTLSNPSSQTPITGKIILPDGTTASEALIYITMDGAQVISTLVKSDGSYILPLNSLRTADNSEYYTFPSDTNIKILAMADSLSSNASLSLTQIHPVPTLTLSNNYDFKTGEAPISIPASLTSFPSFESTASAKSSLDIITPKKNQSFTDQQPLFKGTGLPDQDVQIVIHSDNPTQTTVTTDTNGNWSYRPTAPLAAGNHTIAITTKNSSGILQTITQSFVVYAEGSQFVQSTTPVPTPSSTPTPSASPKPSPIPTATLTVAPTITTAPTSAVVISETPTVSPSQTQTKGGIEVSPTGKTLPETGNSTIVTLGIIGTFISVTGGLLFLLAL
jgi:hypothetical protein